MLFIVEPVTREQWLEHTDASEHWSLPPVSTRPNPFNPDRPMVVREHAESTRRVLSHGKLKASAKLSPDDDSPDVLIVETDNAAAAKHIAALFDAKCAQLK
ncbi:MAG: hypothetical protein AB8H86_29720 [Polyangiales bacterium]